MVSRPPKIHPAPAAKVSAGERSSLGQRVVGPSRRTRFVVSLLILMHLLAVCSALSANLAPSFLQGELNRWLAHYLATSNQDYGALPLELTHADVLDFPMVVEVHRVGAQVDEWQSLQLLSSRWHNFARMWRLVALESPDSELLSDVAARLADVAAHHSPTPLDAIRFVAPKVLSFDEDTLVTSGQTLIDAQDEVVFAAKIVRDPLTGQTGLVPAQDAVRTAKPVRSEDSAS